FNEESVVRAAAESRIPLISAVGHETDWTLIDLVADARAPTPTKAAEWAVPMYTDLAAQTEDLARRLKSSTRRTLEAARTTLRAAARGLPRLSDLLALPRQRFDAAERRLAQGLIMSTQGHTGRFARLSSRLQPRLVGTRVRGAKDRLELLRRRTNDGYRQILNSNRTRLAGVDGRLRPDMIRMRLERAGEKLAATAQRQRRTIRHQLSGMRQRLNAGSQLLGTLSYRSVLDRGFAVVRDQTGQTVRSKEQVAPGMQLEIEVHDGKVAAEATPNGAGTLPRGQRSKPAKPGTVRSAVSTVTKSGSGQGSLF
ncbi:MAG: exodeoxyribonuclease VII large subunit, partial [Hyphomicrobiaceae bacterium]